LDGVFISTLESASIRSLISHFIALLAALKKFHRRGVRGLRASPARIARKRQKPAFPVSASLFVIKAVFQTFKPFQSLVGDFQ